VIQKLKQSITRSEARMADYADNLANWFGTERELTENFKPSMPFESQYVKAMLDKMNGEYRNLLSLQAQLSEFEMLEDVIV
jgi:hypothetical protein